LDRFAACFEDLDDHPRTGNAALHDFHTLLIIALCTVLCGSQGFIASSLSGVGRNVLPLLVYLTLPTW
jgi:hypothetical protein